MSPESSPKKASSNLHSKISIESYKLDLYFKVDIIYLYVLAIKNGDEKMKVRTAKHLGERLRRVRRQKGLTQADAAKRAGLRQPTVSDIEQGANATTDTLFKLLAALDLEMDLSPIESDGGLYQWEDKREK